GDDRDDPPPPTAGRLVLVVPPVDLAVATAVPAGRRGQDRRLLRVTHHGGGLDALPGQRPEQVVAHLGGRLVPVRRVLAHGLHQDRVERRRHVGVDRRGESGVLADVLIGHSYRGVTTERRRARDKLVE